eukprot:2706265-Pleurochrysis_carterae.AAC.1
MLEPAATRIFARVAPSDHIASVYRLARVVVAHRVRVSVFVCEGEYACGSCVSQDAIVGFLVGVFTAIATEPLDVIKTRLQTQRRAGSAA